MAKTKAAGFRAYFVTGFLALLPLLITFFVLRILWNFIHGLLEPVMELLLGMILPGNVVAKLVGWYIPIPTLLGMLVAILLIFLVGVGIRLFIGKAFFGIVDSVLGHIPLISGIYQGVRQITSAFDVGGPSRLRQVVLIKPIRGGAYMMGFLTNIIKLGKSREELALVYVPTNTMYTGDTYLVRQQDYVPLDIPVEDGVKLVVSGGLVSHPLLATYKSKKHE